MNAKKTVLTVLLAGGLLSVATPAFAVDGADECQQGTRSSQVTCGLDAQPSGNPGVKVGGDAGSWAPVSLSLADGARAVSLTAGQHARFVDAPVGAVVFVSNPRVVAPSQARVDADASLVAGFLAREAGKSQVLVLSPDDSVTVFQVTVKAGKVGSGDQSSGKQGKQGKQSGSRGQQRQQGVQGGQMPSMQGQRGQQGVHGQRGDQERPGRQQGQQGQQSQQGPGSNPQNRHK